MTVPSFESWKIDALIGMDYLLSLLLHIDGNEQGATISQRPTRANMGSRVAIKVRSGLPYVTVFLPDGVSVDALVDTGNDGYLDLPPAICRQLTRLGHAGPAGGEVRYTAAGAITPRAHVIRWVEFADRRFKDIYVDEAPQAAIGLGFLENFNTVFDFPKRESWVEPTGADKIIECQPDASGLVVGFNPDGRALIRRIKPGYPAEKLPIAIGDEIKSINGIDVKELSYRRIMRELSRGGDDARLVVKTINGVKELTVKLGRPYEYPPRWRPEEVLPKALPLPSRD